MNDRVVSAMILTNYTNGTERYDDLNGLLWGAIISEMEKKLLDPLVSRVSLAVTVPR